MAVKWIGDAAREIGMSPLDAVEALASRQEYPMNGLLDEDKVQILKLARLGRGRAETTGSYMTAVVEQPSPAAERPPAPAKRPAPPADHPLTPPRPLAPQAERTAPVERSARPAWVDEL